MNTPEISFEFFPPASLNDSFRLWNTINALEGFQPKFISITYGTGNKPRALTQDLVETLLEHKDLAVVAHLTCVDMSAESTLDLVKNLAAKGLKDIVALRGDPAPDHGGAFRPHPFGFQTSCEMIAALKNLGGFKIRVAAYPQGHPESRSQAADLDWLKRKFEAGADEAITQFFFEAEDFLRFRDACVKSGIDAPIIPGILPIENWTKTCNFAKKCGVSVPLWLEEAFERATRDDRHDLLSTAIGTELCDTLRSEGVDTLHFYTLNRPELTRDICLALGLTAKPSLKAVA